MNIKERQMPAKEEEIVLQALAERVARPRLKFLEVGSWCGDSAIILGKIARQHGGNLFCVDWWKGNLDTDLEDIAAKSDIFSLFWKRIQDAGLEDVVIPIRTRSDVVAPFLKEHAFDLIFLDGDHRHEATLGDIELYAPLIKRPGGILCGHDCDGRVADFEMEFLVKGKDTDVYEGVHCGVVLAVGSSFKNYSIDYNIWSVCACEDKDRWEPTNLKVAIPDGYRGFKIFMCKDKFYAIRHSTGSVDLIKADEAELRKHEKAGNFVTGSTFNEVKSLIQELGPETPEIIDENYSGFSIVRYRKQYYVISKDVGPVDFLKIREDSFEKYKKSDKFIVGSSLDEVKRLADEVGPADPEILQRGYKGFNIIQCGKQYYGVSNDIGPIDIRRIKESELGEYEKSGRCIIRNSFEEVKEVIDKIGPLVPELVEENRRGYNIVMYKGKCHAISQMLNNLDLTDLAEEDLKTYQRDGKYVISDSPEEVKQIVDKIGPIIPELIEEGYKGFNVALYRGEYHVIRQEVDNFDLTAVEDDRLEEYRKTGKCFVAESVEDAKQRIEELLVEIPQLMKEGECPSGFNIVRYRKKYYAIDKELADIDLTKITDDELNRHKDNAKCIICDSFEEARDVVPELLEENYRQFNIIRYKLKYYALHCLLENIDIARINKDALKGYEKDNKCVIANSFEEVKRIIEQNGPPVPELVEEGYRSFNIVHYKDKYYAVYQELGNVDVSRHGQWLDECVKKGVMAIANSLEAAKEQAAKLYCQCLLEAVDNYSVKVRELNNEIFVRDRKISKLNAEVVENITTANDLRKELDEIKSKWWFKLFRNFKARIKEKAFFLFKRPNRR